MDSASVELLAAHFNTKISNLKTCIALRDSANDEACQHISKGLQKDVYELEVTMALLRAEVQSEKEKLIHTERLIEEMKVLGERLTHGASNLPERLPKKIEPLAPVQTNESISKASMPLGVINTPNKQSSVPGSAIKKKAIPAVYVPNMDYITTEEFKQVPKYIKGRMDYNILNAAVDELNKSLVGKYKIVTQPKKALLKSDALTKKVFAYKQQESKETKGLYFITDEDIKSFSELKLNATARTILTLLRHCGRIREVRGGNLTRYVFCG